MPYTPASQSPSSTRTNSPAISRSSSYCEDGPRSPVSGRPQPPRSASYLTRHRRSPSIPKPEVAAPPTPTDAPDPAIEATDFAQNGSVRQSPPPVNNNMVPTGMVLSPPDSSENSDGDDTPKKQRSRGLEHNWEQLKEAVQSIPQKRAGSPDRADKQQLKVTTSNPEPQSKPPLALTAEARKISHSRSSTETALNISPKTPSFASPSHTSDDSDDDQDQGPFSKPSLVRKKSGELVKPALRGSSRRRYSSMPGTPTYSKSVHFNDTENQTRHFLQVDKPIAVSVGSSPTEMYDSEAEFPFDGPEKGEREIRLANFPVDSFERKTMPIRVVRIFLSGDKQTLIGTCAAQNISFHKLVIARFTLDYWKTTSEVVAEYNNDPRVLATDGCDLFNFHIKLSDQANIDNKTLLLCVRYHVNGTDHWDNNNDMNYQIDFVNGVQQAKPSRTTNTLGARPLSAIPRSRHISPNQTRGRQDAMDDDFARPDVSSAYHFGVTDNLLGESPSAIKLKPRSKRNTIGSSMSSGNDVLQSPTNGLGGRYDFGASLSAALTSAQDKLGRQSGLMNGTQKARGGSYFAPQGRRVGPAPSGERPDPTTQTERPAMGSDQYRDLVQKFCYFTPGAGKATVSSPPSNTKTNSAAPRTDGADENNTSPSSSGTCSPSPPSVPTQALDGNNDRAPSKAFSPFVSRSASPVPATGGGLGARSASPISFGYPFHSDSRDGYLSDTAAPTAILG